SRISEGSSIPHVASFGEYFPYQEISIIFLFFHLQALYLFVTGNNSWPKPSPCQNNLPVKINPL
ncbi:hypothetical protein EC902281_0779, partial [Escherichia coli 90.2281]